MISWKRLLVFITLVVTLGAGLVFLAPAQAQQEREGIGISPTTLKLSADPGQQISGTFKVINAGTKSVRYRVYVNDFSVNNEDYEKNFDPIPGATSPVSWFKVPSGIREFKSGDQADLNYSISVPAGTIPRGYYAVIFAETVAPEVSTTGVARIKRVGSLVYLTVNGGSVEKGKFLSFTTQSWQRQKPVRAAVRIQNEGNVHFDVTGELRLKNVLGRSVSKTDIHGTLLPSTIRKFHSKLEVGQPFGLYKVEGEVHFLGKTTSLGPNWILVGSPLWIGLILLVLIVWVVALSYWIKRRDRRKKNR